MALADVVPLHNDDHPSKPGQVCHHLPTARNRFCNVCGALIIAHEIRWCVAGHPLMISVGGPRVAVIFCGDCQMFTEAVA